MNDQAKQQKKALQQKTAKKARQIWLGMIFMIYDFKYDMMIFNDENIWFSMTKIRLCIIQTRRQ